MSLYRPIFIPGIQLPGNLFLAPVAGYSDAAFRSICFEEGADLCYTEMVSCEALWRGNEKTEELMARDPSEKYFAIQVFTPDYKTALKALPHVIKKNPVLIDINSGCPVPKIIKTGAGSALMREPDKIRDIITALKEHTDIPISIKIRSGWDFESVNYQQVGETAQQAGADMIGLHPRTRTQGYRGTADWEQIRKLKSTLDIPVLGSGDLYTPEDAKKMLEKTSCDGLLFARGSFGNPFIFSRTKKFLQTGELPPLPTKEERLKTALRQLDLALNYQGERALKEMKKHFCSYVKGIPGAAELRRKAIEAQSREDFLHLISD